VRLLEDINQFLEHIRNNIGRLTGAQQKVADYILRNYQEVSYATIEHLTIQIGVSTASIMRSAMALGYSGYSDMQNSIRKILNVRMEPPYFNLLKNELSEDSFLNEVVENDIRNIHQTVQRLSVDSLNQAIDMIMNAKKIYIIGLRGAFPLASYLFNGLQRITMKAELLTLGSGDHVERVASITADDLLICVSFPRYSRDVIRVAEYAKSKDTKVIGITDSFISPLVSCSDVILPCEFAGVAFINSLVASMTVINYLVGAVAFKQKDSSIESLRQLDELMSKWDLVYDTHRNNSNES
jgi:DNA-binding MurR/RpiR family transcriptional regulator